MRFSLISFSVLAFVGASLAGEPQAPDAKAMALVESGPLYLGSLNSGFKVSEDYFDANLNLVAPVWSSLGSDGLLGGGVLFLEPYVSWGERGEVATSLGLGWRYLFNDQPVSALRSPREDQAGFWDEGVAIGANFFVDLLDTEADNQFWQLGFGAEVSTRYVELRGNYYLPLTDKQLAERRVFNESRTTSRTTTKPVTQTSAPYDNGQGFLVQDQTTSLVATTTTTTTNIRHIFERYEEGMEGWDAEIAVLVPGLDKYCDVKLIGGYFAMDNAPFGPQTGGTGNVEGWKAGIEVRPVPAVALTGMWYEDERFLGSDWMFGARMEIPFEMGDLGDGKGFWGRIRDAFTPRRRHLVERMAEPVRRQNAAIHVASTNKQSSKVSKQSTSSTTHVVSQTKTKIVLGPGPSSTEYTVVGYGSLNFTDGQYGGVTFPQGVLMRNRIGNTVFLPEASTFDRPILIKGNAANGVTIGTTTINFVPTQAPSDLQIGATTTIRGGGLTKLGLGTLTLAGAYSYNTATVVSGGVLGSSLGTVPSSGVVTWGSFGGSTLTLVGNTNTGISNGYVGGATLTLSTPSLNNTVGSLLTLTGLTDNASPPLTLTFPSTFSGTTQIPQNLAGTTTLVLGRTLTIGGTTVSAGTYPVQSGILKLNGTDVPLSGATITVPVTTP